MHDVLYKALASVLLDLLSQLRIFGDQRPQAAEGRQLGIKMERDVRDECQ